MKSRVFGIGPQVGYIFPAAPGIQGYLNLKGYYEFDAQDRPEGWNVWATLQFSPAAPEQKAGLDAPPAMEIALIAHDGPSTA